MISNEKLYIFTQYVMKHYLKAKLKKKTWYFLLITKIPRVRKNENSNKNTKNDYIKISYPSDLKFKPIVIGPSCPTNRFSELIDILL